MLLGKSQRSFKYTLYNIYSIISNYFEVWKYYFTSANTLFFLIVNC